jgi:hypothetical protein
MPIARGNHRPSPTIKFGDQTIEDGNDLVAARHGERAAGAEIVLDVDNNQCVLRHRKSL